MWQVIAADETNGATPNNACVVMPSPAENVALILFGLHGSYRPRCLYSVNVK